jgi:hypothetical protein
MTRLSDEAISHYKQARKGGDSRLGWFLADHWRDAVARCLEYEDKLAGSATPKPFSYWQAAAERKLSGDE